MTDRAVSTVLDVSVCLLLVGAAVLALVSVPRPGPDPAAGRAEELATTLAGSTATVRYTAGGELRTARGTYAGLLGDAARAERANRTPDFRAAVLNATRPTLGGDGWHAQVVTVWRPYEGTTAGEVVVGPAPPRGADVHAATTVIPSGVAPVRGRADTAADSDGYRGVARVLADALLPGANASHRQHYVRTTTVALEQEFDTPAAAAGAISVGRVRVTVRTWSP